MTDNTKYLKASWTDRTVHAKNKAMKAIEELKIKKNQLTLTAFIKPVVSQNIFYMKMKK